MGIARAKDPKDLKDGKDPRDDAGGLAAAFSAVAARMPERPAVRAADGCATYGELDRLAAGLARRLAAAGSPADRPVLLVAEPGLLLTAAMLGVWRAGRFFVALDPVAPAGRNARIVEDAEAEVVIAAEAAGAPRTHLALDAADWLASAGEGSEPPVPPAPVGRGTIAALTYTSGSTGRPKGVIQTHGAVLRNAALNRAALGVEPGDRCTLLYPPSVNPALRDLATALLSGAELLPYLATLEGIETLGPWLAGREITVYSSGVTLFRQLAATFPPGATLPSVRRVRLGGEAVGRREIERFRRLFRPGARLVFGLGTTETGTLTTCSDRSRRGRAGARRAAGGDGCRGGGGRKRVGGGRARADRVPGGHGRPAAVPERAAQGARRTAPPADGAGALSKARPAADDRQRQTAVPGRAAGAPIWLLRAAPGPGSARLWCRWVPRDNGWGRRIAGPLRIEDVRGDHIQMLNPPFVATLADVLKEALPAARPAPALARASGTGPDPV